MRVLSRRASTGVVILALWACGSEADEVPADRSAAQVEVAEARTGALHSTRRYLGTVRAASRAELAAGADGAVLEVSVREGDSVRKGQVLLRVDPRLARAGVQAARADRQAAERGRTQAAAEAERFERAGNRVVSELELERATSQAATREAMQSAAAADLARARATLSRHTVVAPFDGVVTARLVDPGDWVSPGTPALEIVAEGAVEIFVRVEPELLADVSVGDSAQLRRGEASALAQVAGVVRALDAVTRTAQLRLRPTDALPPWLLAGAAVDVVFELSHEGEGVLVPRDALVEGIGVTRVVLIEEDLAKPIEVEVLERGTSDARVRAAGHGESSPGGTGSARGVLREGTRVVTRGNERLRSEQPVSVVEGPATASGADSAMGSSTGAGAGS